KDSSKKSEPKKAKTENEDSSESEEEEEPAEDSKPSKDAKKKSSSKAQSPAVRRLAEETDVDPDSVEGTGKDGRVTKGDMLKAKDASQKEEKTEPAAKSKAPS